MLLGHAMSKATAQCLSLLIDVAKFFFLGAEGTGGRGGEIICASFTVFILSGQNHGASPPPRPPKGPINEPSLEVKVGNMRLRPK
jgi:hypothetical protein